MRSNIIHLKIDSECQDGLCGSYQREGKKSIPFQANVARSFRYRERSKLSTQAQDFLDIIAVVRGVDRMSERHLDGDGRGWLRYFKVLLPVRNLEFWNREDASKKLIETLNYLTDDDWQFKWLERSSPLPHQGLVQPSLFQEEYIQREDVLFSGGLDACAGICDLLLKQPNKNFTLISVGTSSQIVHIQSELFKCLEREYRHRVYHEPLEIDFPPVKGSSRGGHRSRSFLFAGLGSIISYAEGNNRLFQCENGIASLCLPFAPGDFHCQTSHGVHPKFLRLMSELVSLVFDREFRIENPYLFQTKGEMCKSILEAGLAKIVSLTVSCDRFPQRIEDKPMCGICGPCLLRQCSLHSANLPLADPRDRYKYDITRPNSPIPIEKRIALRGIADQVNLIKNCFLQGDKSWIELIDEYPDLECTKRDIALLSGLPEEEALEKLLVLLFRYVQEWQDFPIAEQFADPVKIGDQRRKITKPADPKIDLLSILGYEGGDDE